MARFQNIDSLSDVGNFENIAFTDNLRIECSLAGAWVSSLLWCIILALMVKVGTLVLVNRAANKPSGNFTVPGEESIMLKMGIKLGHVCSKMASKDP